VTTANMNNPISGAKESNRFHWFKYAAPNNFYDLAGRLIPWVTVIAVLLTIVGMYIGFFVAPTDFQQGDAYRIIFLHVPAAWMSMFIYMVMAFWAALGLAFNTRMSSMMASALAPTGAMFTFLALWTGALILLFLYIGFMALQASIDDVRRADKAGALIALVGVINVPIIYFSVQWWNTLHQGSSINMKSAPTMAKTMLLGMLIMALAFWAYTIAITLYRARCIVLEREQQSDWVKAAGEKL